MRYVVGFVLFLLALGALRMVGCGTDSPSTDLSAGVKGEDVAEWCHRSCFIIGCRTPPEGPESCIEECKRELAAPCGGYLAVVEQCVDADCHWDLAGCDRDIVAYEECRRELRETCEACPEGTVVGDCIAESSHIFHCREDLRACYLTYGDCNAGPYDGLCSIELTAGLCNVGYETCVAQEGDCTSRAP